MAASLSEAEQSSVKDSASTSAKPKRVRTGCLTCRERHLKCDEALPTCNNCRKSNRACKRGVRLNYIALEVEAPPCIAVSDEGWEVKFQDDSREIAGEYQGGLAKYAAIESDPMQIDDPMSYDYTTGPPQMPAAPSMARQSLPNVHDSEDTKHFSPHHFAQHAPTPHESLHVHNYDDSRNTSNHTNPNYFEHPEPHQFQAPGSAQSAHSHHSHHSHPSAMIQHTQYASQHQQQPTQSSAAEDEASEVREMLGQADETLYMQVFVEEVGLWMDTMDAMKHFSELLPFHALGRPMLLNAFLACGVRHLTLVNPAAYKEEKALGYYDKASTYLLRALENPERDSVICATTAVILNVYEIMTEKAAPRMNHIAGARALIKECGWNAKSSGIGAACFWLNVGLETLSNLHFNWQSSWPPDQWGLDFDLEREVWPGREEVWTHKMLYIIAKVGDFRSSAPKKSSPNQDETRRQHRWQEWNNLRSLCDIWSSNIPRTMQPMAYLYPYQTASKSAFPEVWLIKRTTIVARLFYHTAMVLLAQCNPTAPRDSHEMKELELQHAHQICGIVAHVKDRGVASVAIRSLAHAAECLTARREQEEVLQIFTKIHKETGWRIGFIPDDLRKIWGWGPEDTPLLPTHENPSQGMSNGLGGMMKGSAYQFDQYAEYQRLRQEQAQEAQARAQAAAVAAQRTAQMAAAASSSPHNTMNPMRTPPTRGLPSQIVNPLLASADFSLSKHPYMEHYVAPSHHSQHQHPAGPNAGGLGLLELPPVYSGVYGGPHSGNGYPGY